MARPKARILQAGVMILLKDTMQDQFYPVLIITVKVGRQSLDHVGELLTFNPSSSLSSGTI